MKEFNLEEFKKDASRRVVTRDGREVRILCTDRMSEFPIVALVFDKAQQEDIVITFPKDGKYAQRGEQPLDLFFAPTKREGWVNVENLYNGNTDILPFAGNIYQSKEEAINSKSATKNYIATVKIEWEE